MMKSLEKEYREQMEEIHAPEDLIQKTKEMMRVEKEKWEKAEEEKIRVSMFRNGSYVNHFRVFGKRENILRERKFRVGILCKRSR